jgi:hypothetical protein
MKCSIHPEYKGDYRPETTNKHPQGCPKCWIVFAELAEQSTLQLEYLLELLSRGREVECDPKFFVQARIERLLEIEQLYEALRVALRPVVQ